MIVVCAGMQRAGTRWHFDMVRDLMMAAGCDDASELRDAHDLHTVLFGPRCNLRSTASHVIRRLSDVEGRGHTFVVKTHCAPSAALRHALAEGRWKATYIYRDPRDVIVSALERGAKVRSNGKAARYLFGLGPYTSFARMHTVGGAALWFKYQVMPRWKKWMSTPGVHMTRYEDLLDDTPSVLRGVSDYLGLDASESLVADVAGRYARDRAARGEIPRPQTLEKGIAGRFREVLSPGDQQLCARRLGRCLEQMGYAV